MSKIAQIKVFNDILDRFLNYIEKSFLYLRSDVSLIKNTLNFIRKGNPRMVVEQFLDYALKYEKQIFDCDEDFFLNVKVESLGATGFITLLTSKLKNIWVSPDITDQEKARVFLFFQQLIIAGKRCII